MARTPAEQDPTTQEVGGLILGRDPETDELAGHCKSPAFLFMQTLKAGDVRQEGDQQRSILIDMNIRCGRIYSHEESVRRWQTVYSMWNPVCLVGETILRSDLLHLEFRRP